MGQYHLVVNLSRREFINPHKLGDGAKLIEQLNSEGGTLAATHILLACSNGRGGGDIPDGKTYCTRAEAKKAGWRILEGDTVKGRCYAVYDEKLYKAAKEFIGRWAGDRIAVVGDYTEKGDIKDCPDADILYQLHKSPDDRKGQIEHWRKLAADYKDDPKQAEEWLDKAERLNRASPLFDITDGVLPLVEASCDVKITGDGWRGKKRTDGSDAEQGMAPDIAIRVR